ncbi:MAG: NAD(P)-dependent glycerol-3-phosphate dehydrogenase, partial [Candidatus Wallbacteria bacterium]|nr:NAD(P)-dependent glycerol-3-phosphate dehydrogenase [Candidatus Wallbacteria bacterium]
MSQTGRVAILGAGSWGTVLALVASSRASEVRVWCRNLEQARQAETQRVNARYLQDVPLPDNVHFTERLPDALQRAGLVLFAVPTEAVREVAREACPAVAPGALVVSASKGIEISSHRRVSEILREELPPASAGRIAVLSGPNLAREMAAGKPTGAVVASESGDAAREAQRALSTPLYRLYSSTDVIGVEIGGALKNIIAIGAGIVHGLAFGANSMGALLTRGLAEIARYGVHRGARPLTFNGLSGMGDLVTTCSSPLSRNQRVGQAIARGEPLDVALRSLGMVAEGVPTTRAVHAHALQLGVEMPITREIHSVLFEGKDARAAVVDLMTRDLKSEEE